MPEPRWPSDGSGREWRWQVPLAAIASLAISLPLILYGTPDVESYQFSVFSTVAFARSLAAGVDPWAMPDYGFGIPLPNGTWFIKFPPALLAAFFGPGVLYATIWYTGHVAFAIYFLKLTALVTRDRRVSAALLITALASFSSLGPTYVNDWVEHFLGWALIPAILWGVLQVLLRAPSAGALRPWARCTLALGLFVAIAHQNDIVTLYSALALMLAFVLRTRPTGVLTVGVAMGVALAAGLDVLVPTVQGMLRGGVAPIAAPIVIDPEALSLSSYGIFVEPLRRWMSAVEIGPEWTGYEKVPFFGLCVLGLAAAAAVRAWRTAGGTGALPGDVVRAVTGGFLACSVLTLLPPWVVLNVPRMWSYRDMQTVLALLSAAIALDWLRQTRPRLVLPLLLVQLVQVGAVAEPIVSGVLGERDDQRLFGYARQEHALFQGLRQAGIGGRSRVLMAGDLDDAVRGSLADAGITASTDFALDGIPLVNAWYRGATTPALGSASLPGRYGAYETLISWNRELRHLTPAGRDVLGITHVLTLEGDAEAEAWAGGLVPVSTFELPDGRRVRVFRNPGAWSHAVLLPAGTPAPPLRAGCDTGTVFCRDYDALWHTPHTALRADGDGGSLRIQLPGGHGGGTILISMAAGPGATARVDGQPAVVRPFLDTFATVDVMPDQREVMLSLRSSDRAMISLLGAAVLAGALLAAVWPQARGTSTPPRPPVASTARP